jgi:beta-lactamase superfamily II metal-dependent hydrolase
MVTLILLLTLINSGSAPAQTQPPPASPVLRIIHFNVGNGDATLMVVEDGSPVHKNLVSLLVDGGSRALAASVVIPGIRDQKIEVLDNIIATRNDPDHTAGLNAVLQSIPMTGTGAFFDRDRRWPITMDAPTFRREILREDWPFYLGWATLGADDAINCTAANGGFRGQVSVQEAIQENHCGGIFSYVSRGAATC